MPCALSACSSHLSHHESFPLISAAPKSRRLHPEFSATHLARRERPERRDRSSRNSQALCSPSKRRPVPLPNAYPGGNRSCIAGQAVFPSAKSWLDLAVDLEFCLSDTGDNANDAAEPRPHLVGLTLIVCYNGKKPSSWHRHWITNRADQLSSVAPPSSQCRE